MVHLSAYLLSFMLSGLEVPIARILVDKIELLNELNPERTSPAMLIFLTDG